MQLTVMLCSARVAARARVKLTTAPLLVLYGSVGITAGSLPRKPATEAMLMMRPPCWRSIMCKPTARLTKYVPSTLTWITRSQASNGISANGAPHVAPALFTRMSTRSSWVLASRASVCTSPGSVTSPRTAQARCPASRSSVASASISLRVRATTTMAAPAPASARATAMPIPRPAPVTTAARPASVTGRAPRAPLLQGSLRGSRSCGLPRQPQRRPGSRSTPAARPPPRSSSARSGSPG